MHVCMHLNQWTTNTSGLTKSNQQYSFAGLENVAKAEECRAMLIFNHVSYADGILLGAYFLPCGLAKATIADIPFFGTFCRVCLTLSTSTA